jgi:hypothetical protein
VIALLAALLTRAFLNQPTPLIQIRRSPQALALLQGVFRPLGQVAPLELSGKRQHAEATLSPAKTEWSELLEFEPIRLAQ